MKSNRKQSLVWQFLIASSLVGFTAGLFAGMSESPVATALVAGMFGLLGGGGVLGLLVQRKKEQDPPESNGPTEYDETQSKRAASATSCLCVFCIIGVFVGIGFREEGWLIRRPVEKDSGELTNIPEAAKDLERSQQLKLVILQSELLALGVPRKQNNQLINSYIVAHSPGNPDALSENQPVRELHISSSMALKQVLLAFRAITDKPADGKEDTVENRLLKSKEHLQDEHLKEAYDSLKDASREADKANQIVERITMPELTVVLDLIAKYRETYGASTNPRAVSKKTISDLDGKPKWSIRP